MSAINHVCISGNLARDAELRATSGGTQVLTFSVAVNERRKTAAGDWEDYTNWVSCTMFGRRAEGVARYLTKGAKVAIEGRLRWHSWETDAGEKRSKLEVIVSELEFMSAREDGEGRQIVSSAPEGTKIAQPPVQSAYLDEDIPFS